LDCTSNANGGTLTAQADGTIICSDDDDTGTVITVAENGTSVVALLTTLDFLGSDFSITESPSGEANIAIDYLNSAITRSNQSETITSSWTFSSGLTLAGNLALGSNSITTSSLTISSAEIYIFDSGIS